MKRKALSLLLVLCLFTSCLGACNAEKRRQGSGKIYLYGENHSVESIMLQELELWSDYYHNHDMRHQFVEYPYYAAEYLNLWMKADNDDILNALYDDIDGTAAHTRMFLEYYKRIKEECPETVFHGTDIGHQYDTTGKRFLEYLEEAGRKDTEQYRLTEEVIEQGRHFYGLSEKGDSTEEAWQYREETMTENFIREFESLNGKEDIMGIYGSAHTVIDGLAYKTPATPCMANALYQKYGDALTSVQLKPDYDLTGLLEKKTEPIRTDTVTVGGKEYTASYFGSKELTGNANYDSMEFWRLEDAYKDFRPKLTTGDKLPCYEYPMEVEKGQVFLIRFAKKDGTTEDRYYRSDGTFYAYNLTTREFRPE